MQDPPETTETITGCSFDFLAEVKVPPATIKVEFMACTAAQHQGVLKMFWLHFGEHVNHPYIHSLRYT